jgi:hypothetical protein
MANSPHAARWISNIADQGWEIHLFPTDSFTSIHPDIKNVVFHSSNFFRFLIKKYKKSKNTKISNYEKLLFQNQLIQTSWRDVIKKMIPDRSAKNLARMIKRVKPDIVHSMHIQEAGYLTLRAKKMLGTEFPKWIVTNWGSELDLFRHISDQSDKIKEVILSCDYFSGECSKDLRIVSDMGFKGKFLPVIPNSGGIDFDIINRLKQPGLASDRRIIMLKGYQNWAGRALVGLRALERCSDILKGYKVLVYSVISIDVIISAELFTKKTGIETEIIPFGTPHEEILKHHGRARISIGLSITDAISTSMLEAMVMGSFPIQSNTSCAEEWFKDGKTGIMVHPEDPDQIEQAIRGALSNDVLVNTAAELNYKELFERLEYSKIKVKIVKLYEDLIK